MLLAVLIGTIGGLLMVGGVFSYAFFWLMMYEKSYLAGHKDLPGLKKKYRPALLYSLLASGVGVFLIFI